MAVSNPLVAGRVETATAFSGAGLLEDGEQLVAAFKSGDWASGLMAGVAAAGDVAFAVVNPIGAAVSWAVGWILDHMEPLKGWLNKLTGDAGAVAAGAATWTNIGAQLQSTGVEYQASVAALLARVRSVTTDAYGVAAAEVAAQLEMLGRVSSAVSTGLTVASAIVQVVHDLVRDAIGDIVGLAVGMLPPSPKVAADVAALAAKWASRLGSVVDSLKSAVRALSTLFRQADELMAAVSALMSRLFKGGVPSPGKLPSAAPGVPGPRPRTDAPSAASAARSNPDAAAVPARRQTCENDPVDVATGWVVLDATDVVVEAALPLVLSRRYSSGFGRGRFFGSRWASTLDEHVEQGGDGVAVVRQDASILLYEGVETVGSSGVPVAGEDRWRLTRTGECAFRLLDPVSGVSRVFRGSGSHAWLVEVVDRAGRWVRVERDASGLPLRVRHHGGAVVDVATRDGRVVGLDVPGLDVPGVDVSATYGASATETSLVASFEYVDGRLVRSVTGQGQLRLSYDVVGQLTSWLDGVGVRFAYVYDDAGRCVWQSADNGVRRYAYDYSRDAVTGVGTTVVTDAAFAVRTYTVDARDRVLSLVDGEGHEYRYGYDEWNRRVRVTDPLGHISGVEFDDESRVVAVTDAAGATSRVELDGAGLPVRVVDAAGAVTTQAFDAVGRLVAVTDPTGATTTWTRGLDPAAPQAAGAGSGGEVVTVRDATGVATVLHCDAAGRVVRAVDGTGAVTRYERDVLGHVVAEVDPTGATTRYRVRADGRLTSCVHPDGACEDWGYDAEGNLAAHTDASGRTTTYAYAAFDVLAGITTADGARVGVGYDSERRPVTVTNATGATWQYTYDRAGLVVAETDYDGQTTSYTYDAAGRLATRTSPTGTRTTYTHDPVGRLIGVEVDGEVTHFQLDPAGRLLAADSPGVMLRRELDAAGRVIAETVNEATTTYVLDAAGRVLTRTTPAGITTGSTYDEAGRRVALVQGGHRLDLTLDEAGRTIETRFAGGRIASGYDSRGRLTHRSTTPSPHPISSGGGWSIEYGYAPTGELLTSRDSATGTRTLTLDPVGRISTVTATTATGRTATLEAYGYDPAGNLTSTTTPHQPDPTSDPADPQPGEPVRQDAGAGERGASSTALLRYQGTRLVRAGRDRYDYDNAGRVTRRQRRLPSGGTRTWDFTWDGHDRLRAVATPDGSTWTYTYDPLGRRISKTRTLPDGTPGETVHFTWDGPVLIEQRSTRGGRLTSTTWDHDGFTPIAHTTSSHRVDTSQVGTPTQPVDEQPAEPGSSDTDVDTAFAAIVTDLVGTPLRLIDPTGATTWTNTPTTWGHTSSSTTGTDMPLRFPGQYHDTETDLHYNLHRYYNPTTARYLTPDPLGLTPTPNPHTYPHNPTTHTDPLGLAPSCEPPRFITTPGGVTIDRQSISAQLSRQRQLRHVQGAREYARGGYFPTLADAQRVLDDFHNGTAQVLGINGQNIVVRAEVIGYNVNRGSGYIDQVTQIFLIKGTVNPSIVPFNPNWTS